jgi:hypothetical protein
MPPEPWYEIVGLVRDMGMGTPPDPKVAGIYHPVAIEVPKVTQGKDERQINALEWGLANINADDVWSQYGDKGDSDPIRNCHWRVGTAVLATFAEDA